MQVVSCEVRIAGSPLHVVPKMNVTPAEILILRQIHGEDSVINIRPIRQKKVSHLSEFERLVAIYGNAGALAEPGGAQTVNLHQMFPGAVKTLPISLAEIGILDIEASPEPEPEKEAA